MRTLGRRSFVAMFVLVALALLGATGCNKTPTSPDGCGKVDGYDPCLPKGKDNVPNGPPAGTIPLSVKVDFFKGDCSNDELVYKCTGEILPTAGAEKVFSDEEWTYVIPVDYAQRYTARACMTHPQFKERKILLVILAGLSTPKSTGIVLEGVTRSPICVAVSFNMTLTGGLTTNTNAFSVTYSESDYDILESSPVFKQYGIRIKGSVGN